jgi:hypothetical protein
MIVDGASDRFGEQSRRGPLLDCSNSNSTEHQMAAEADLSLPQLTPRQQSAIPVLALQSARHEVKRRLQAQGRKPSLICAAEITRLAESYAQEHRAELLPQAIRRAQQIYPTPVRNSQHSFRKRRPDPKAELLCASQVRNGAEQ